MPVVFPEGFKINNSDPIDSRTIVSSSGERFNNLDPATIFNGLIAFETETTKLYVLTNTGSVSTSAGWSQIDVSGSGFGLQETLESGNSSSLGISSSFTYVGEVSFTGSSSTPVKLTKDISQDYIVASGSGLVIQPIIGTSPTAVEGSLIYSASNFYVGIEI
tara:strand:+ start:48 stop:533 length:486 start_codon:yes stop_codon:yes gene_type:complete